ncbi:metal ABC transporter permease [Kiritimatiellota bacterium B12222]|nr:metal ABC transporter permease [Kiritimatiellota bacterium B12222]
MMLALVSSDIWEVISLQNYNTRLVVLSTMLLGIASGFAGSFLLLRKRSLMSDTLSHACLPGIGLMFIVLTMMGGNGKSLGMLLVGATISGLLGVGLVTAIRNNSRIKDDAAMGIVLSVFFGLGIVFLSLAQTLGGAAAGLESFIYGKTASMVDQDLTFLKWITPCTLLLCIGLQKEFSLVCFDENFARSLSWPVQFLDMLMMGLMVAVTVVGLQAVGLILIIAFMIIPAAAARFWTEKYRVMWILAGVIGGICGWLGASFSALLPRMPAGAVIVLISGIAFLFSMFFGTARGVCKIKARQIRMRKKIGRQHFLRAAYEILEVTEEGRNVSFPVAALMEKRSWTSLELRKLISIARKEDHVEMVTSERVQLSEAGFAEAARYTRNHRLWELYLIRFADVATRHVDRDADRVEHVLGPSVVRQLEKELNRTAQRMQLPKNPHALLGDG